MTIPDTDLIREAVKRSGLSARVFANEITWRDERTVRRWTAGDNPMPPIVRERLEWFLSLSADQVRAYVNAATVPPARRSGASGESDTTE